MKNPTPKELDTRITQVDDAILKAEAEVDAHALPAAAGGKEAVDALARATATIAQLKSDHDILSRARTAAVNQIDRAAAAEAAAERAAARKRAGDNAKALLEMARRIDALADEYRQIAEAMPKVEQDLWRDLRAAECAVPDGTVGRKNLVTHAVAAVTSATSAPTMRSRPCTEIAAVAWGVVLDDEDI